MKAGDKVEHILNKEYLLVLEIRKDKILCRTKDMREVWFYPFELKAVK